MKEPSKETGAIRTQTERTQYGEHSAPLFLTSSFAFETAQQMAATFAGDLEGHVYSRYANPNTQEFIDKMCLLEGAEAGFATASGMAAVWCSLAGLLNTGDHIIANRALFGSTHQLMTQILPRFGITCTFVDGLDTTTWTQALTPATRMFLIETPSNPGLRLTDLTHAASFCRRHDLILNVDNCFCTPVIQTPIAFGAHLVTHSATKYIDGQGRVLGGVVVGREDLIEQISHFCRHTGPALSPFNAWLLSKSIETLHIRMERHCQNAQTLASRLEDHRSISKVLYPHLASHPQHELARRQMALGGGIITIELKNPALGRATAFLDRLQMTSLSANLGDSRTIATHPASTTHSKLSEDERQAVGISSGMCRLSVGLENVEDIWIDINRALTESE